MQDLMTTERKTKRSSSKEQIVFIKRKQTFIEESNNDPEVQGYFDMAYKAVGSYYKETGKQYGSGLTSKEIQILMPELIGIFPEDRKEFSTAVKQYFRDMNTKIPPEGKRLNIALEQEGELALDNMPVNITDYVIFKHASEHPEVGKNEEEADKYQHMRFYIEDTENVISSATVVSEKEDATRLEYYKIVDDEQKVEQMLILLGVSTKNMKLEEKKLALKSFATIEDDKSTSYNELKLDKFMTVSKDKRLQAKYEIEEMIRFDILKRVGTNILFDETGDEIGGDLTEAALWYTDKANIKQVNVLKARLKEFGVSTDAAKKTIKKKS
jgi:hypothetical protein